MFIEDFFSFLFKVMRNQPHETVWRRFTDRVVAESLYGCWMLPGGSSTGYPTFYDHKTVKNNCRAHRIICLWLYGDLTGFDVDHLVCSNTACVNPLHLIPSSHRFNLTRANVKGPFAENAQKTHCKNGHELKPGNLLETEFKRNKRICLTCRRAYSAVYYNNVARAARQERNRK